MENSRRSEAPTIFLPLEIVSGVEPKAPPSGGWRQSPLGKNVTPRLSQIGPSGSQTGPSRVLATVIESLMCMPCRTLGAYFCGGRRV
jgi:hypothetical protein